MRNDYIYAKGDIITIIKDFHCYIRAYTTINEDGTFTIFINGRCSQEQQYKSWAHEINHILNRDFEKETADQIEFEGHRLDLAYI